MSVNCPHSSCQLSIHLCIQISIRICLNTKKNVNFRRFLMLFWQNKRAWKKREEKYNRVEESSSWIFEWRNDGSSLLFFTLISTGEFIVLFVRPFFSNSTKFVAEDICYHTKHLCIRFSESYFYFFLFFLRNPATDSLLTSKRMLWSKNERTDNTKESGERNQWASTRDIFLGKSFLFRISSEFQAMRMNSTYTNGHKMEMVWWDDIRPT